MTTIYHTEIAEGAAANASVFNAPLGQLDAAIAGIIDGVAFTGQISAPSAVFSGAVSGSTGTFTGAVVGASFTGDGSGLTGIATGTGGVTNTGSTTIGADTDQNGVGAIALQTGLVTRMTITAAGDIKLGAIVPKRLNAVYCLGDSLTATPTYPNKLATLLGSPWVVRNNGIAGNTTTQMTARIATHCLNAGDGEYIVILGGINDVATDVSAATIEGNLQAMYSAAAAAGLTVIACTITPFKTSTYWSSGRQAVLDAVNAWILGTATDVDYTVDSYDLLEDGTSDTLAVAYDSGDHLHLSTAGYELLGTTIHGALTWTAATADITLNVSGGTIGLNQSLLSTDDVTFHNISVSGTLDMPVWKPATDGISALNVQDANGYANLMTFDTTNGGISIGPTTPEAGYQVKIGQRSTGAGNSSGLSFVGGKVDCVGSVQAEGMKLSALHYAIAGNSTCAAVKSLVVATGSYAGAGLTATTTGMIGVQIDAPSFSGAGSHVASPNWGLLINNQGNANSAYTVGLEIASQTGSGDNYAFVSNAGKHSIGSSAATIGFYGVTPIARATLATGAGATVDNVITALQNLGLVKQS